jgi:hypothetical protein
VTRRHPYGVDHPGCRKGGADEVSDALPDLGRQRDEEKVVVGANGQIVGRDPEHHLTLTATDLARHIDLLKVPQPRGHIAPGNFGVDPLFSGLEV